MPASKVAVRVRFKVEAADEIAERHGHTAMYAKAEFFGSTASAYSRVVNGVTAPGENFIAAALASPASRAEEGFCFDTVFEVVDR